MNLVKCAVCGRRLRSLVAHVPTHGLTAKKYRLRFPGQPVISRATLRELGVHGTYLGVLSRGRHRKHRSTRWHPGEFSARPWAMLRGAVEGRTLAEIAGAPDVNRKPERVGDVLRGMGLMADGRHYVPTRYDFGRPVTADYVAPLLRASALDRPRLADVFDLPLRVVHRVLQGPDYRLAPRQAESIIEVRDRLLTSSHSIPTGGQGGGRSLLMILVPNLRDTVSLLQEVFARSRAFLRQSEPRLDDWQDWVCEQASLEKAGRLSGDLFLRFVPFAPEVSPFVGRHLDRLRGSDRIGLLVFEALGSRLGMRPSALHDVLWKRAAVRPASAFELQRLLLEKKDPGAAPTPIYAEAADLYRRGKEGYGKLARRFFPEEYARDPEGAKKKMQQGVRRCLDRTARYHRETTAASSRAAARNAR